MYSARGSCTKGAVDAGAAAGDAGADVEAVRKTPRCCRGVRRGQAANLKGLGWRRKGLNEWNGQSSVGRAVVHTKGGTGDRRGKQVGSVAGTRCVREDAAPSATARPSPARLRPVFCSLLAGELVSSVCVSPPVREAADPRATACIPPCLSQSRVHLSIECRSVLERAHADSGSRIPEASISRSMLSPMDPCNAFPFAARVW